VIETAMWWFFYKNFLPLRFQMAVGHFGIICKRWRKFGRFDVDDAATLTLRIETDNDPQQSSSSVPPSTTSPGTTNANPTSNITPEKRKATGQVFSIRKSRVATCTQHNKTYVSYIL
jgi:hypothetical protein